MSNTFQAGRTYTGRSICDYNCRITVEVVSRTEKTIKARTAKGLKSLKIHNTGDGEFVFPWGRYSMAPVVRA